VAASSISGILGTIAGKGVTTTTAGSGS
jgi:hypothetical protein